jgi:hypothetical protein
MGVEWSNTAPAAPTAPTAPISECSICTDAMCGDQAQRRLPCGHDFHARCIATWFRQSRTCPVCRARCSHRRESDPCHQEPSAPPDPRDEEPSAPPEPVDDDALIAAAIADMETVNDAIEELFIENNWDFDFDSQGFDSGSEPRSGPNPFRSAANSFNPTATALDAADMDLTVLGYIRRLRFRLFSVT